MNITIHSLITGRKTEYTEDELKEEVRRLRKHHKIKARGTNTIHFFQGSAGSALLECEEHGTGIKVRTAL